MRPKFLKAKPGTLEDDLFFRWLFRETRGKDDEIPQIASRIRSRNYPRN